MTVEYDQQLETLRRQLGVTIKDFEVLLCMAWQLDASPQKMLGKIFSDAVNDRDMTWIDITQATFERKH